MTLPFGQLDENKLQHDLNRYRRDNDTPAGGGMDENEFKLANGVTTVRVLPPPPGRTAFHKEISRHFVVTDAHKGFLTCPRNEVNRGISHCPICVKQKQLLEAKDEASVELANKIRRQVKTLLNILVLNAPNDFEKGRVYYLFTPKQVMSELLGYDKDEQSEYPDITGIRSAYNGDALSGVNFKIIRSGSKLLTTYSVQPSPRRVNLEDQMAEYGKTLADLEIFDIFELFPPKSKEELQNIADQIEPSESMVPSGSVAELKVKAPETPTSEDWRSKIRPPKVE